MKFGFGLPSGFRGEDFLSCEQRTEGRRTTEHVYNISYIFISLRLR